MPTMVKVVEIIISDIVHTVYMRFSVFSNFSKLLVFFAPFGLIEISNSVMRTMLTMANIV